MAWTGGGQFARQLIQVGTVLVLGRLLTPSDFGLVGMAMFLIGVGQLLAELGIGSAIVQSQASDRVVLTSAFWLNFAVAATMCAALIAGSPLIAAFYRRPDLVPVIIALSFTLILNAASTVPGALLYQKMKFADITRSQLGGSLIGSVAAIAVAVAGGGMWALVTQPLAGSAASLALLVRAERWTPTFEFSWPKVSDLAKFSGAIFSIKLLDYVHRNAETLLVGRFLGAQPLGIYSMATQIMLYPLQQVSSVFVRVLFPVLIELKNDRPRLQAAYLKSVSSIATLTFPLMGGLFIVAREFVLVVFGQSWIELVPVLKVLSWVGMMQSVGTTIGVLYISTGRAGLALKVTLFTTPIVVAGMAVGLAWGVVGVAVGYAAVSLPILIVTSKIALGLVGLRLVDFYRAVLRPLCATAMMMGAVFLATYLDVPSAAPLRLLALVSVGATSYVVATLLINRAQVDEVRLALRELRRRH